MADNSFDEIDARFFHQRIKVPKIICQKKLQEIGDLTILAPENVSFNHVTGQLEDIITIETIGLPQLRTVTVLPGKIINQGVVSIRLLVNGLVVIQLLEIPFQGVIECPGATPGPETIVQKHDVQIEGFSILPFQTFVDNTPILNLVLKVILEICVIVARETIIKVNAAETFCR